MKVNATARQVILGLSILSVFVVYVIYLDRIIKKNLSITEKELWIGGAGKTRSIQRQVTEDVYEGKLCRLEAVDGKVRDQWGGTIKDDREVPCGKCSSYNYKVGAECRPYAAKFEYTNFANDMNDMGYCGLDDSEDIPTECPFRTPPQK
jgi:hypothetical protein